MKQNSQRPPPSGGVSLLASQGASLQNPKGVALMLPTPGRQPRQQSYGQTSPTHHQQQQQQSQIFLQQSSPLRSQQNTSSPRHQQQQTTCSVRQMTGGPAKLLPFPATSSGSSGGISQNYPTQVQVASGTGAPQSHRNQVLYVDVSNQQVAVDQRVAITPQRNDVQMSERSRTFSFSEIASQNSSRQVYGSREGSVAGSMQPLSSVMVNPPPRGEGDYSFAENISPTRSPSQSSYNSRSMKSSEDFSYPPPVVFVNGSQQKMSSRQPLQTVNAVFSSSSSNPQGRDECRRRGDDSSPPFNKEQQQINNRNSSLNKQSERLLVDQLEEKINLLSKENETLLNGIDRLSKAEGQLKRRVRELESEVEEQKELFTEEKLNEAIESILKEKSMMIAQLDAENNRLKAEIRAQQSSRHTFIKGLSEGTSSEEKQRQLMESSEVIAELTSIIRQKDQQLELKEATLLQMKDSYRKERESLLSEKDQSNASFIGQLKALNERAERQSDEIILLTKQHRESSEKAAYYENSYRQASQNVVGEKQAKEELELEQCLRDQKEEEFQRSVSEQLRSSRQQVSLLQEKVEQLLSTNEAFNNAMNEKHDELGNAISQLEKCRTENEALNGQLRRFAERDQSTCDEQAVMVRETEEVFQIKLKVASQETSRLKSQVEEFRATLQRKDIDAQRIHDGLHAALESAHAEIFTLKETIGQVSTQLSQTHSEARISHHTQIQFDSTLSHLEKINQTNKLQLEHYVAKIQRNESQKEELQQELIAERENSDLIIRQLESEIHRVNEESCARFQSVSSQLTEVSKCLEAKKNELQKIKEELPLRLRKMESETEQLRAGLFEKSTEAERLEGGKAQLQQQVICLHQQLSVLHPKIEQLTQANSQLTAQLAQVQGFSAQQNSKIAQLEKVLDSKKAVTSNALKQAETALSNLKMEHLELSTKNKRLQDDLSHANHLKQLMKDQMEDIEKNFKRELHTTREESTKEIEQRSEREKRELNFSIQRQGNAIRQWESEKESMLAELEGKQHEIEAMSGQLQRIAEREKNLYTRFKQMEIELNEVRKQEGQYQEFAKAQRFDDREVSSNSEEDFLFSRRTTEPALFIQPGVQVDRRLVLLPPTATTQSGSRTHASERSQSSNARAYSTLKKTNAGINDAIYSTGKKRTCANIQEDSYRFHHNDLNNF